MEWISTAFGNLHSNFYTANYLNCECEQQCGRVVTASHLVIMMKQETSRFMCRLIVTKNHLFSLKTESYATTFIKIGLCVWNASTNAV